MALPAQRTNILTSAQFVDQKFKLQSRQQYSRQKSGVTLGKDFGSAIWMIQYVTNLMKLNEAVTYEAILNSLDGVIVPFEAGDLRRRFPLAYPTGVFSDTGTIFAINSNNKAIRLDNLAAGFKLSVGDYLSFDYGARPSRALHQVVEAATASGSGITPYFEIRPFLRPGLITGTSVKLKEPKGMFTLDPEGISSQIVDLTSNSVSFSAVQYI